MYTVLVHMYVIMQKATKLCTEAWAVINYRVPACSATVYYTE